PRHTESLRQRDFVQPVAGEKFPCDHSVFDRLLQSKGLAHCIHPRPGFHTIHLTTNTACNQCHSCMQKCKLKMQSEEGRYGMSLSRRRTLALGLAFPALLRAGRADAAT